MTSGLKFSYIICSMYNSVLDLTTRTAGERWIRKLFKQKFRTRSRDWVKLEYWENPMPIRLEARTRWTIQLKLGFGPFIYGIFEILGFGSSGGAFRNPNGLNTVVFEYESYYMSHTYDSWLRTGENAYFGCKILLWRLCRVSYDSKGFGQLPLWLVLFEDAFRFDF